MRILLTIIILVLVILFFFYADELPFELSLGPSEVCDDIRVRQNPEIIDEDDEISVSKTEYTDGVRYLLYFCFLR